MSLLSKPPIPAGALSPNARTVLQKRYLIKDERGNPVESPEELFWRVATVVAEADRRYGASDGAVETVAEEFYRLMTERRFEPNSPTLMNAGRPLGQLSACFVLPVSDALSNGHDGIYDTLKAMALIHQSGGGTGFSFSRLRPKGSMVRSTTGVASGPVSFMKLYDASTEAVKQGGTRRGANMGIVRVDHPDILEFITCKEDLTQITNFNISVAVTDAFMRAVKERTDYALIDPHNRKEVGRLDANAVWDRMIEGAWRTGEPGVFFIDEANRYNPVPSLGSYEATNPCGEQPLLAYDVCNLGSINVGYYVRDGRMDWDAFKRDIHLSTHFLDNIIDVNKYPLVEIDTLAKRIRRIGLGVMGFADALVRLGIPYDSEEGVEFGRTVMEFVDAEAKRESERLAVERGPFADWARSIWGPEETAAKDARGLRIRPMKMLRNCNVTTVAPTGTISIIAGCSSGLEPLFAVAFMRNQAGSLMPDVNEDFVAIAKREGWYSDDLMERIAKQGTIKFPEVPAKWQRVFVTANEIAPEWHIRMQAAFQRHCDSAISKTTNFGHTATVEDVRTIYELAFELRCKGVTVYRDGSRDNQVLSTGATEQAKQSREQVVADKRRIGELEGTNDRAAPRDRAAAQAALRVRGGEPAAARQALASRQAAGHDDSQGDAVGHDVREHQRGRPRAAVRGVRDVRQGRWRGHGRRRSNGPADFARAALRDSAAVDPSAAARAFRPTAPSASGRTRCCRFRTRSVSRSRSGGATRARACRRSCSRRTLVRLACRPSSRSRRSCPRRRSLKARARRTCSSGST